MPSKKNATGLWALRQKLGSWNMEFFDLFIEEAVLPLLPRDSVLVMDNARIHKSEHLQTVVKKAQCSLLFLPPYSPDFSPIEPVWSWLKQFVRGRKPADDHAREDAIIDAQKALPPQAALGWFKHCGLC